MDDVLRLNVFMGDRDWTNDNALSDAFMVGNVDVLRSLQISCRHNGLADQQGQASPSSPDYAGYCAVSLARNPP